MCSQIRPTWVTGSLHQLVSHHPTFVIEGVVLIILTPEFLRKNWKNERFLLSPVQQLQPAEILHFSKLLQNIKVKILCDVSLYTRKMLRSRVIAGFDTSAILNLSLQGQQSRPILRISKWHSVREDRDSHCTPVVQSLLDNFLLGIFLYFRVTPKVQNLAGVSN